MDDCEDGDADIYNDLPDFRYDETIDKLNATIARLEAEHNELHSKFTEMKKEKEILEAKFSVLSANISSLLKTAKFEVQRKDRTISDLRQQLKETSRRNNSMFGVKRQFENTNSKNHNTEIKNTFKRESQTCEPPRKKTRFSESDKLANHCVSRNEAPTNGNLSSVKPPPKTTHSSQKENVPLTSSQMVTPVERMDRVPKIAAPSLPIIDCPTVFTARMYRRLNSKSVTQTVTLPSVPVIPSSGEEPLNRVSEEKTKVNEQQKRAIESEKTVPKTPDGALKLPSSPSFSQKSSIPVNEAVVENLSSATAKSCSTIKRSELNPCLVSALKKVVSKSDTNNDSPLSPSNKCEVGKIESDSARSVVRPPVVSALLSSVHSTERQDSTPKTKKQTPISEKNTKPVNKNGSQLKLPPHLKGKSSARKTFVPISSAWNCLKPPSSVTADETSTNKCQQNDNMVKGKTCSEVTCITSELTFKVDDERSEEKRKLALDVFGSPVKWADDCSSDSVKVDGLAAVNRKKTLYSMFGSPYKNGDSCSSEPYNFILPPGAYEDSCWTNQPPDKASPRLIKPPTPSLPDSSSNLVTSKDKSSESTSRSNDRDCEKMNGPLPPPAHPVGKKNQSVFSPLKESKTATSLPSITLDDRSSTGICFPFKTTTRYEDSVLGQFDDTAQFVSALAKVDTKISPLSTPLKNPYLDESLTCQPKKIDSLPINNPTSFKEVFHNKSLQDVATVPCTVTSVVTEVGSSKPTGEEVTNAEPHGSTSVGTKESSLAPEQTPQYEENICNIDEEVGLSDASPATLSSSKFIHRSNFSSSSVFTMSSDSQSFLDKPVNVLQPRKTPRAAINKRSPVALNASCKDVKLNPRIAIPDAFLTEQEERVRQWQKNHLYETTLKCGSSPKIPSPTKGQVKTHSSSSDLMKPSSPTKAQAKMFSPGKNRTKTSTSCKGLDTPSSVSITQVKTDAVNRLQPKRVPRHPVIPKKNCDGILKAVTTIAKPEGVTTAAPPPPVAVDGAPCAFDSTIKALNMIRSVVNKSVAMPDAFPISVASDEKEEAVDVPPVTDAVDHIKIEPVNNEKSSENPYSHPKKSLVQVICKQRSSKYVEVISQIKPNTPKTSITELCVSKKSASSASISPAIVIKKPVFRRDSDFKRSSALKKPGEKARDHAILPLTDSSATTERVLVERAKGRSPSNRKLIRRKSAPNLNVSSQYNETRVTSTTPTKSSSSTYIMERRKGDAQAPSVPTAGTNPNLHVSSQHNETRVTSKTPAKPSSSTYIMEKRKEDAQAPSVPTADPSLHLSSQHNEKRVTNKTPAKSSSSTYVMEKRKGYAQAPSVPTADTINPNLHVSSPHNETRVTSKTRAKSSSSIYRREKREVDAQVPPVPTADSNLHVSSQHDETRVTSKTRAKSSSSIYRREKREVDAQVPPVPTAEPNLHVSSQHNETRVTSKTPTRSSSSTYLMKKRKVDEQVPPVLIADTINPIKWLIHPIELDIPQNIYEFINSSFSCNDPRVLPRPIEPRIPLIVEDRKDSKEDNLYVRTVGKPNLGLPNEFSPNVSAISSAREISTEESQANLTRPIVTSTPFPTKASRRLAPNEQPPGNSSCHASGGEANSHPRGSSSSSETVSSKTPKKNLIVKKRGRAAGRTPTVLKKKPVKKETRCRRKLPELNTKTQPELTLPKENCKEPTKRPRNKVSPEIPKSSTSDKLAAAPLEAEGVAFISATSPEPKSVVVNYSNHVRSMAPLSHSVTSTSAVQPKLISRKRRNPNFSSVTVVHSDRTVIIPRKRHASFTVHNSST